MFSAAMNTSIETEMNAQRTPERVFSANKITYRLELRFFICLLLSLFIYVVAASIASGWALLMAVATFTTAILSVLLPTLVLHSLSLEISGPDLISAGDEIPLLVKLSAHKLLLPLLRCLILRVWPVQVKKSGSAGILPASVYLDKITPSNSIAIKSPGLKRGIRTLPTITIETSFPFGLAWCKASFESEKKIAIVPKTESIEGRFLYRLRSGAYVPGDSQGSNNGFQSCYARGVRAYNRSDSRRHIHWALSARHGKLMVREFEREGIPAFDLALDNGASWSSSAQYELAITAVASLLELGHALGVHPELFVLDEPLRSGEKLPGRCIDVDEQMLRLAALELDAKKSGAGRKRSDSKAFAGRQNALILVSPDGDEGEAGEGSRSSVFVIRVAEQDEEKELQQEQTELQSKQAASLRSQTERPQGQARYERGDKEILIGGKEDFECL